MRINMQDKVKKILLKHKSTRDNDPLLVFKFWKAEHEKKYPDDKFSQVPVSNVFVMWSMKDLTHPSAIMRARRKVQEKYKETRGKLWYKRHQEQENVKEDLGYAKRVRV